MMAQHAEPMDVDCMDSEFDNKENTYHHSNVLPCTEKGYEELDVSELNMKLRYSMTPASSPMSKSYTAYLDNRNLDTDDSVNCTNENANLTHSLNSTMTKNDSAIKSLKSLPLQTLPTEQFVDSNGNPSVLRQLDSAITENVNITLTVTNEIDENLSLPSTSSSALHTPEATTPTKEIKNDGSPIMRGLKSVFNMFRSSQSPIPPPECDASTRHKLGDTPILHDTRPPAIASTPIAAHRTKDGNTSKRSSPLKDSIVFNEDLEKELSWKEETTILFSEEKIPIHKLFFQHTKPTPGNNKPKPNVEDFNSTVEYMDISYNDLTLKDKSMTELQSDDNKNEVSVAGESDSEFVDCETTFTKNESHIIDIKNVEGEQKDPLIGLDAQKSDLTNGNTQLPHYPFVLDTSSLPLNDVDDQNNELVLSGNYTKETSEILAELEKLEEAMSPNSQLSNKTNISNDADETKQKQTYESPTGSPVVTKNMVIEREEIETQDPHDNNVSANLDIVKQLNNLPEEQNSHITQTVEPKIEDIPVVLNKTIDTKTDLGYPIDTVSIDGTSTESTSDFKYSQEVLLQLNTNQSNKILSQVNDTTIDFKPQIQIFDQQLLETTLIKALNNTEIIVNETNTITLDSTVQSTEEIPKESFEVASSMPIITHTENPSDIPLPDEDDVLLDEALYKMPEASLPHNPLEILQMTNTALKLVEATEYFDPILPNTSMVDKIGEKMTVVKSNENIEAINTVEKTDITEPFHKISTLVINEIINDVVSLEGHNAIPHEATAIEIQSEIEAANIVSKLDITETLARAPNTVALDNFENDAMMLEGHDTKTLDTTLVNELEDLGVANTVTKLNVTETLDKTDQVIPEIGINNKVELPEDYLNKSNDLDQTYHHNANNVTHIREESQSAITSSVSFEGVLEQTQNKIQETQPMDTCSVNVCLNQTHDLPDLINETISVTNTNVDSAIKIPAVLNSSKQELVSENIEKISDANDLSDVLEIKPVNKEHIKDIESDTKIKIEPTAQPNTTVVQQNDILVKQEVQSMTVNTLNTQEGSNYTSESVQVDNIIDRNSIKDDQSKIETLSDTPNVDKTEGMAIDEEIIVSENNSPYVSLMADVKPVQEPKLIEETFEELENPFTTTANMASSPPITSKGYNFNFDEIENPFATKTKIRLSPPLDTPTKSLKSETEQKNEFELPRNEPINRRKSQPPERKRPAALKKKFNTSFDVKSTLGSSNKGSAISKNSKEYKQKPTLIKEVASEVSLVTQTENTETEVIIKAHDATQILNKDYDKNEDKIFVEKSVIKPIEISEENKTSIESIKSSEAPITSSSEQSTYYSVAASSTESLKSKNVFNLPEIDDVNFNPFATKSKMRQSPPPYTENKDPITTRTKMQSSPDSSIVDSSTLSKEDPNCTVTVNEAHKTHLVDKSDGEDKMETELMEKETSNIINTTSSSKATDNQDSREIHTEDEDTVEGPFLEADDAMYKISDFDTKNVDMMQFNDMPAQGTDDNPDDGELFIDAETFEFLLNQNQRNVVSDSGKESLFLKFDPLFAKRISSDGVVAALSKIQKRQSTPTKPARLSLRNEASPIAGPSKLNITYEGDVNASQDSNDDLNVTVAKPMMVVTPAVNPTVTPRSKSITPTRSNRRSITFTSPAIAVIDRLLSMSANNSLVGQDTTMQVNREQNEADLALTQLRELLAEKEIQVYNLRSESKDLKDRLATMETQMRILEFDGQERLKKINDLNERLTEKTKINKSMAAVVEEYERTIASLIAEIEQDKKRNAEERMRLINERDEQTAHLASMEVSFNDLHSKYEKSKQVILTYKANEDTYKKSIKDFQDNIKKMQSNYELLKQHATSKLNHANQELEKMNRTHEAEVLKMNAMIKRKELHITSLEETLAQKTKANEELTAICDELINKVG